MRILNRLFTLTCFLLLPFAAQAATQASAIFAGGCFWCMEPPFDALEGVISTTSGYAGGSLDQPTYQEVSSGRTGHLEVLEVVYRPDQVRYEELLEVFWHNVDPLDAGGQFCDRGPQYATAIFTRTPAQREAAEASKAKIQAELDAPVVTPIRDAGSFFAAEEYHQDFYKRSPIRYKFYRQGCGRDARLNQLWSRSAG